MRIVVKVGGAILDEAEPRKRFAASVASARAAGHQVVVVHGGGAQMTRLADAQGVSSERIDGLRVTGPAMARIALQSLAGEVNADLVLALATTNVRAIGLTGADGHLMTAAQRDPLLGLVGDVTHVDASVLDDLVGAGFTPVIATLAPSLPDSLTADSLDAASVNVRFLNVNADAAVAPLAAAFKADAVLFLSDVPHVRGDGDAAVTAIDTSLASRLAASGAINGGMIPKVEAGLAACASIKPGAVVRLGSGLQSDSVLSLLASGGTSFVRTSAGTDTGPVSADVVASAKETSA